MNKKHLKNKIVSKMLDNFYFTSKPGITIASPSSDPPYQYHWIRDAALSIRVFIDLYRKTNKEKYFVHILNYIETESKIQQLNTLTGLGEPKVHIDCTPFNGPWGRPQNDGPALRSINLIKISNIIRNTYPELVLKIIYPIIQRDIKYILMKYNETSFDLWEEINGWHFYTRMVQLKCLKDYMKMNIKLLNINLTEIRDKYNHLLNHLKHHISENGIISSFDKHGNISKFDDASILLSYSHISFDADILREIPVQHALKNAQNLVKFFQQKYVSKSFYMIGRYFEDKYYQGHTWIICSLGLVQYWKHLNINVEERNIIIHKILSIDVDLNLSEQYDIDNNLQLSAEKLTWNYSELYFSI
jgi:glucoamylase